MIIHRSSQSAHGGKYRVVGERLPLRGRVAVAGIVALTCLAGFVVAAQPAAAAVLRVPDAFPTVQAAIDAAAAGDTILVGPGTYAENLDFHQKDVRIESTDGPAATTIDAAGTTVTIGPRGALVGFTVTGGTEAFGAGMSVRGNDTLVQGNVFRGNSQGTGGFGAAIGGNAASPTIDRNVFRNNSCDGQFVSGVVSFINVSSPRVTNNLFMHNACRAINMTVPEESTPVVINNTIIDNPTGIRVQAGFPIAQQAFRNNVITGNLIGLLIDPGGGLSNPIWDHNLVFGNDTNYEGIADQTGIAGNISADPMFADAAGDDFHPRRGSPVIDAGSDQSSPSTDFDGNARPDDGNGDGVAAVDIGAFEVPAVQPVAIDVKPGNDRNLIRLGDRGSVSVAVLSAAGFDAPAAVDRASPTFGETGDEQSLTGCAPGGQDVNGDGRADLVCSFLISKTNFQLGDTQGVLKATAIDGTRLAGRDMVAIAK